MYLALIAGLITLGLIPRCTLEVPTNIIRLRRILSLLNKCHYSLHDLSRVELCEGRERLPRFNMPFEAGLSFALSLNSSKHRCAILEAKKHRLLITLSDLNGYDPHIHDGTPEGILNALTNIYAKTKGYQPTVKDLKRVYAELCRYSMVYKKENSTESLFSARAFKDLVIAAKASSSQLKCGSQDLRLQHASRFPS